MIRLFDFALSLLGILLISPLLIIITIVGLFDTGRPLFKQERVGRYNKPFTLFKFRTMHINTADQPTHMTSISSVTKFGSFLRRTKLDELPQLWNVLTGDMSLVGPRPCLFSQQELVEARNKYGIFNMRPGITGLAKINKIDMSQPELLAEIDNEMMKSLSLKKYFTYIFKTLLGGGSGDRVKSL